MDTGLLVDVDVAGCDADDGQRVDLPVEVLFGGGHPRVAQFHAADRTETCVRNGVSTRGCELNFWDAPAGRSAASRQEPAPAISARFSARTMATPIWSA